MKRAMTILLLLAWLPGLLAAGSFWQDNQGALSQLVSVVLTIFGVPLLIKLGKKLGLTIDEQQAQDAIAALINIIVNIELGTGGSGAQKKDLAVQIAKNTLSVAQQRILERKYGSLEAAVQVAFERSSLNNKGAK